MNTEIITVVIGILGAIIGVYYKENFNLAKAQKKIATKLTSYLNYEHDLVLFSDEVKSLYDFSNLTTSEESIFSLEYLTIIGKESKQKKIVLKELLKEKENDAKRILLNKYLETKSESDILFNDLINSLVKEMEDFKNGITMISDDEASLLSLEICQYYIYYKRYAIATAKQMVKYLKTLRYSQEFDYDQNNKLFIDTVIASLNYFMVLKPLHEMAKNYANKNTSMLALKNIFS